MDASTYFDLNLVTGSDKVNPLTVDRPNYEKIDDQMHKNQINSVVEATELKSGNVHAITCLTEGAVFFRFTATSDFAAGDVFTYNGTPVSAVLPDGSGLQQGAFKINGTVLCSIIGTLLTVYSFTTSGIAADSEKLGGQLPAYYAKATDAISTYIHSRIGTENNLVGTGNNGKVKIVANIAPGDTWKVNGSPVTAFVDTVSATEAMANKDFAGKWVYIIIDGANLYISATPNTKRLLWSNNTPYVAFPSQQVNVQTAPFKHIMIDFVMRAIETNECTVILPTTGGKRGVSILETYYSDTRDVTISGSGILFGEGGWYDIGKKSLTSDNAYMVPRRIWGIM